MRRSFFPTLITPQTAWSSKITRDSVVAPTPGTLDPLATSDNDRIHVSSPKTIKVAHLHYDRPSGTGGYTVELWRERNGERILIATCTADGSKGNFGVYDFTFADEAYRRLEARDYLLTQVTAKPSGPAQQARAEVDIHFAPERL